MKSDAYKAQLEPLNISYEKGCRAKMELVSRAAERHNMDKEAFMPDCEIPLKWIEK